MAFVRHGVLVAGVVKSIPLPDRRVYKVEISNVDGAAKIFALLTEDGDTTSPTINGNDCEVLPASMNSLELNVGEGSDVTVKLISSGTPAYSVRAE